MGRVSANVTQRRPCASEWRMNSLLKRRSAVVRHNAAQALAYWDGTGAHMTETMTFEGTTPMTDRGISDEPHLGPVRRFVPLLKTMALVVTIVGAVPTAITAYHAWQYKVPFTQVSHRLAQYEIWERNIDCKIDYKALSTSQGTKVDAGACPSTRDISLKVSTDDGKATYEWIAYNQLQKPGEAQPSGFLDLIDRQRARRPDRSAQRAGWRRAWRSSARHSSANRNSCAS